MSYVTVKAALIAQLAAALPGTTVQGYEPRQVEPPAIFVLLDGFTRTTSGQITAMSYRLIVRLALPWQETEAAELALDPYVNAIAAAIDADPRLGGALQAGIAAATNGQAGFWKVSGIEYRILDTIVTIPEKGPWQGGL